MIRYRLVALASFALLLAGSAPLAAQMAITARTPSRVITAGGTTVEVLGTGFPTFPAPSVTVGGTAATNVVLHGPSRLTFVTPARRNTGQVTVTVSFGPNSANTTLTYIGRTRTGVQGARRPVFDYAGKYVAFESRYPLVPDDTNGVTDVYVRNRTTGALRRVSVSSTGAQGIGGESTRAAISATGRFVAFQSHATNLVAADTNGLQDIFVHDRDPDGNGIFDEPGKIATERVSLGILPGTGPPILGNPAGGDSFRPVISGDGRYVSFHSRASNLVAAANNNRLQVFVFDRQKRVTRAVSDNVNGGLGNGDSRNPAMSLSGRFIAYESAATNIAGGDPDFLDIFLRDRDADENGVFDEPSGIDTRLVSQDPCENPLEGHAINPSITHDGRYVVFATAAGNAIVNGCAPAHVGNITDVYIWDRLNSTLRRLSEGPNGASFPGSSGAPAISGNGNLLLFTTQAQNAGGPIAPGLTVGAVNDGKSSTGQVPSPTNPTPPPADVPPPPPTQDQEDPATSGDGNTTGGTNEPDPGTNDGEPVMEVEEPEIDLAVPFISALAAAAGPTTGGNVVEIQGGNFASPMLVQWNGVTIGAPSNITATRATIVAPNVGFAGPVDVRVLVGPAGNSQASNVVQYTYVPGLSAPAITNVNPATDVVVGGVLVTITGSGFLPNPTVRFGGFAGVVNLAQSNANTIRVTAPAVPSAGAVTLTVENTDGGAVQAVAPFVYTFPAITAAPTISTIAPNHGPVSGGTAITITGTNFTPGSTVTVGGVPATGVQVPSNMQIVAVTPAGAEGSATVVVTTTVGAVNGSFTYDPLTPPVLTCAGTDTDGDGMPNDWETQYGLNPADGTDGALDADGDGVTNAQECTALTHPRGNYSRFLAEGATGSFFDTRVAMANPGATPARVLLRFQTDTGQVVRHFLLVPAQARRTLDLRLLQGLEAANISTTLESDVQIVLDRTMRWDNVSRFGAHAETSSPAPSLTWYLAEGATHGTFDLFYLLQNPSQTQSAQLEIKYLLPSGAPIVQNRTIAPNTRATIYVDQQPGLASTDVSGVITSLNGVPIIAERAMYSSAAGTFAAGHDSAGVTSPSLAWFFAEGSTGNFFDTFLLFANPNASAANIQATYLLPSGQTVVKPYSIPANGRITINVQFEDPALAGTAVSVNVVSTNGVTFLAERSMWWPHGQNWTEAHNAAGATATGTKWAVADGEAGTLPDDTATFLLVANTSAFAGTVRITLLFETGAAASQEFAVPGNSRTSVPILTTDVPANPGYMRVPRGTRFSAIVESLGGVPAQIVVERAMYWNANGQFWSAGSDLLATKLQ